jgi:hypothetical protein
MATARVPGDTAMPEYDLLFALGGATGAVTVVASSNHARDVVDTVLGRPGWRREGDDPSSPPVWKIVLTPANARSELAAAAIKQGLRVAEITADDVVPYELAPNGTAFIKWTR